MEDSYKHKGMRRRLIQKLREKGIMDQSVLQVMEQIPRHVFFEKAFLEHAYQDKAFPIGHGQTISQPTVVAHMTEALKPDPNDRVLEIGTGCGYQTAILAEIVKEVFTIEILEPLANQSRELLEELNYHNIQYRMGDGYAGWPEAAPFDKIIVTAMSNEIPLLLVDQLKVGGQMMDNIDKIIKDNTENKGQ